LTKWLLLALALAACDDHEPKLVGGLPLVSNASCTQDSDCELSFCPNQCNGGQPVCKPANAFGVAEARAACPCILTPQDPDCFPAIKTCIIPCPLFDNDVHAGCVTSHCVTLLRDGGTAP
jgi:hypothetical protein